jgi:RimJ/RimL family protein N-acetyltransferase
MDLGPITLQAPHLTLRPLALDDAAALASAAAESRDNYDYIPVPNGVAAAQAYVESALRQKAAGERYPFAILWQGRVVGTTSYYDYAPWRWPERSPMQRSDRPDALEIGYTWLAASAQRTPCNTTAKLLLLTHAFETWQVHRVSLRTDVRNARSQRAIERLGAKFEGILRADKPALDDTVRDSARYSIVRAEWAEVRAGLERRLRGA